MSKEQQKSHHDDLIKFIITEIRRFHKTWNKNPQPCDQGEP